MNESFKYKNFFAGTIGFIIPIVYIFTLLIVLTLAVFKKIAVRHLWIVVVCIYGLGINHYYIARSLLTSYYVTAWPLIIVCAYWLKMLLTRLGPQERPKVAIGALVLSIYALFTNHSFIAYPNAFNFTKNAMVDPLVVQPLPADRTSYFYHLHRNEPEDAKLPKNSLGSINEEIRSEKDFLSDDALTDYYRKDFDFSRDAALIQALTDKKEKVAVISSFEIKILMQAVRKPLFYYFPLLNSRPKHMRTMPVNFLHTNGEKFNRTALEQLNGEKPKYIFLEKIFLNRNFPKAYADSAANIIPILDYVHKHYAVDRQGEYIVAMKRK